MKGLGKSNGIPDPDRGLNSRCSTELSCTESEVEEDLTVGGQVTHLDFKGLSAGLQALLFQPNEHLLLHGHLILVPQLLYCWLILHSG